MRPIAEPSALKPILISLLAAVIGLILQWLLKPIIGNSVPFLLLYPAVFFVAWVYGFIPALIATALSAFGAILLLFEPRWSIFVDSAQFTTVLIFILANIAISKLLEGARQNQRELDRTRLRLQLATDTSSIGIFEWASSNRHLQVTDTIHRLFGLPSTAKVHSFDQLYAKVHKSDLPAVRAAIEQLSSAEASVQIDFRVDVTENIVHWLSLQARSFRVAPASVIQIAGTIIDITDRKQTEDALRESQDRFQTLANHIAQLVWMADENGFIFWYNRRWFEFTGTSLEEMKGRGWQRVLHPDHLQRVTEKIQRCIALGQPWEDTFPLRGQDGSYRWFLSRATPIRDRNEHVQRWFGTSTDVTEQLEIQERLRESEHRYKRLADAMPQLVWTAGPSGEADYYNARVARFKGIAQVAESQWNWTPILHPDDLEYTTRVWQEAVAAKSIYQCEHRLQMKDGSYRWHLSRGEPALNDQGDVVKWFGTATDIQNLRETQEDLQKLNQELEEFAYVASHDIQEPLRKISIYSQLLLEEIRGGTTENMDHYSQLVQEGVQRIQMLVKDLLIYSRTIHHAPDTDLPLADLNLSLSEALSALDHGDSRCASMVEAEPLPIVRGDENQLSLVFQNLLSNAIKYQPEGQVPKIQISAQQTGEVWIIAVKDNGIGFAPEYAGKIFGLFKRLYKNEYPGTGLGLAICKRIVERYRGRIRAESQGEGTGATFYIQLLSAEQPVKQGTSQGERTGPLITRETVAGTKRIH